MTAYASTLQHAPKTLSDFEQKLLLKVTGQRVDGFRDHCLYSLALGTGLREHEILALNIEDVFERGKAKRRVQLKTFKRSNDDARMQEVLLPDLVRSKLNKLYQMSKRKGRSLASDAPIFMSQRGTRLSDRQVRRAFKQWQERAGFERPSTFHSLRHTACTNLYRASKDIRLTQRFARHMSLTSTAIYTHPTDEDLLRSLQHLTC